MLYALSLLSVAGLVLGAIMISAFLTGSVHCLPLPLGHLSVTYTLVGLALQTPTRSTGQYNTYVGLKAEFKQILLLKIKKKFSFTIKEFTILSRVVSKVLVSRS